jgi:hypothetical protein
VQLSLGRFIETVKEEILSYQKKHRGEAALFRVEHVRLDAAVATSVEPSGKVNLYVVELGAGGSKEATHRVKIKLRMIEGPTAEGRRLEVEEGGVSFALPPSQDE